MKPLTSRSTSITAFPANHLGGHSHLGPVLVESDGLINSVSVGFVVIGDESHEVPAPGLQVIVGANVHNLEGLHSGRVD